MEPDSLLISGSGFDTGQASLEWQSTVTRHWNLQPVVTVFSEVAYRGTYATIFEQLNQPVPELGLPARVQVVPGAFA